MSGWLLVWRWRAASRAVSAGHLLKHDAQRNVYLLPGRQAAARTERHGLYWLRAGFVLLNWLERSFAVPKRDA